MMFTALVSCLPTALTEAQREAIQRRRIEWVILNRRGGRVLLDMIGEKADLLWLVGKLTDAGLDPILLAAFNATTGKRIRTVPLNAVAWRAVAPDVVTVDAQGVVTLSRPTAYVQSHSWLGWGGHNTAEEED